MSVKASIQFLLQKLMGYRFYLFAFAIFSVFRFRLTKYDKEFAYFLKIIPQFKGHILLDIGANIGVTSSLICKRYPHYKVWAFEPVHLNIETLQKLIRFFKLMNIEAVHVAVGEIAGEAYMITPIQKGVKKQGLSHIVESNLHGENSLIGEIVKVISLDDFAVHFGNIGVAAIKIDVENYELFVLKGGVQLMRKYKPLVFAELWEDQRKEQCIQLMELLGYSTKVLHQGKLIDFKGNTALNYFFIPHEVSLNIN